MNRLLQAARLAWVVASATGIMMAATLSVPAGAQCLPGTCNFSISGKKGGYLSAQVDPEDLTKADSVVATAGSHGLSLAASSVNQGEIAGAGIRMPQTEARMMVLIDKIRAVWPSRLRSPPQVRVRILGTLTYSPLAHPDGVITIPLGLIERSKDDDDIVWALGHEFSHVALAHFAHQAEHNKLLATLTDAVDCTRMGIDIAQTRIDKAGSQITISSTPDRGMQAASLQIWSKQNLLDDVLQGFNQHLTRKLEDAADASGFDLAHAAGYSRDGYTNALNELAREEALKGDAMKKFGQDLGSFAKQSSQKAGVKALAGVVSSGGVGGVGGIFTGLGSTILKNGENLALNAIKDEFMADHRPAKNRREGLDKYVEAAFPGDDPDARLDWITAVKAMPEYQVALATAKAVDAAPAKIPGEICAIDDQPCHARVIEGGAAAIAALEPARKSPYRNTPLVADTAGRIEFLLHNYSEADRIYSEAEHFGVSDPAPAKAAGRGRGQHAAASAPAPPGPRDAYLEQSADGFADHVQVLVRMKSYPRAMTLIAFAKARLGDDERFLPSIVTVALHTNNAPLFMETIHRCSASGDLKVKRECNLSMMEAEQRDAFENMDPVARDKLYDGLDQASAELRKSGACGLKAGLEKAREGTEKVNGAPKKLAPAT